MVLDREQHEALRILLQERLIGFIRLDGRSHSRLLLHLLHHLSHHRGGCLLSIHLGSEGGKVGVEGLVLLVVSGIEVELLDRRFHLERLDG